MGGYGVVAQLVWHFGDYDFVVVVAFVGFDDLGFGLYLYAVMIGVVCF